MKRRKLDILCTDVLPWLLMLGDCVTVSGNALADSLVGRIAQRFPQWEVLNGSVKTFLPSNYPNVVLRQLAFGIDFDDVLILFDISDVPCGYHHLSFVQGGNLFDMERSAFGVSGAPDQHR